MIQKRYILRYFRWSTWNSDIFPRILIDLDILLILTFFKKLAVILTSFSCRSIGWSLQNIETLIKDHHKIFAFSAKTCKVIFETYLEFSIYSIHVFFPEFFLSNQIFENSSGRLSALNKCVKFLLESKFSSSFN